MTLNIMHSHASGKGTRKNRHTTVTRVKQEETITYEFVINY